MTILTTIWHILFIVFFFGFAIFIHEFGHLLAALWRGLHVEKFSIGFGPKMFGFTWRNIEFIVGCLPFGGYVMLPQLDPEEKPKTSKGEQLPPGAPFARAVTAFAGPFFNILFGFFLACFLWWFGTWQPAPSHSCIVNEVPKILPLYTDGLEISDKIVAVNDVRLPKPVYWDEACDTISEPADVLKLTILRNGTEETLDYTPRPNPEWLAGLRSGDRITKVNGKTFSQGTEEFTKEFIFGEAPEVTLEIKNSRSGTKELHWVPVANPMMEKLGAPFFTVKTPLTINAVLADSQAARAELKTGDQILEINGTTIVSRTAFNNLLKETSGTISLLIARGADEFTVSMPIPEGKQATAGNLGLGFFAVTAEDVHKDSPADKAGLRYGDNLLKLDGKEITDSAMFISTVRASGGQPLELQYSRGGELHTTTVTPVQVDVDGQHVYQIGMVLNHASARVLGHPTPWRQFKDVLGMTGRSLSLLFLPLRNRVHGMVSGTKMPASSKPQIGVKHMSGPLGIIMMLWYKLGTDGIRGGLAFIVLITFSLAFVNLLPLPVLDGGHIAYAIIEMIIRRRLPVKFIAVLQNIFAFLLIALMLYITLFDGNRIWQRVKLWFMVRHNAPAQTEQLQAPVHDTVPAETGQEK